MVKGSSDTASVESLRLPHLETFCKAAELLSFTATAHALGMTQAAVSQRISALEGVVRTSLFTRSGGRVGLTEAGQKIYEYGQRILALHREALEAVSQRRGGIKGELVVAASSIPGEHVLPRLLARFSADYPDVRVLATVTDSRAVLDQLQQNQAQIGLVGGKVDSPHLEWQAFAKDEIILIVPKDHAWAERSRIGVKELAKEALVIREPGSGSRWCFEQALAASGLSLRDVKIVLEMGSNQAIKEAVHNGTGIALLSRFAVQNELANGQFKALSINKLKLERDLFVVHDKRRALSAPARLFLTLLRDQHAKSKS